MCEAFWFVPVTGDDDRRSQGFSMTCFACKVPHNDSPSQNANSSYIEKYRTDLPKKEFKQFTVEIKQIQSKSHL